MQDGIELSKLFRIRGRFTRSVNVARDYYDPEAIEGYIITSLSSHVISRVVAGLAKEPRNRSWSITGPYGSGKSACCLFLSKVLGDSLDAECENARASLRKSYPKVYNSLTSQREYIDKGVVSVIVSGSRQPLSKALLHGLNEAVNRTIRAENKTYADLQNDIQRVTKRVNEGKGVFSEEVTTLFEEFTKAVCFKGKHAGVLVVVDELGKLLEYASIHPETGDIFLLQSLAEAANGSGNKPLLLLTVLHQAFERYASHLGHLHQQEWAKVQGRFENIPFLESNEQLLTLIGAAIERKKPLNGLDKIIDEEVNKAVDLSLASNNISIASFKDLLGHCSPLHPVTALVLTPLFKSGLAQNERSLFAFLSSGEPYGLQDFLNHTQWDGSNKPFYRLDMLYDYIFGVLGSSLMTHSQGKRWAEIAEALSRLPKDAQPIDYAVVKAIGLLGILGDKRHLKASKQILIAVLSDNEHIKEADVKKSLERLQEWKITIYRRHSSAFALWEGSDIELDERYHLGLTRLTLTTDISSLIGSRYQTYPYISKRHLHTKGTLRYFEPEIIESSDIKHALQSMNNNGDGRILFVLPQTGQSINRITKSVIDESSRIESPIKEQTFFAVLCNIDPIRRALEELMAWEWVQHNTSELEGDRIARRELSARITESEGRFAKLCDSYFDKHNAFKTCNWIYCGKEISFRNAREIGDALSAACDIVFNKAPIIDNELVNRRLLSSAAAAARASLMEQMIVNPSVRGFGIEGTPPSMSIYISVLERTGLHHKKGDSYIYGIPSTDPANISGVWEGMDKFFDETEGKRGNIQDLFEKLKRPPFGIREGILPILLLARILEDSTEIALYEEGVFVPHPNAAFFERMIKAPSRFEIQRYRISGPRKDVFRKLASLLTQSGDKHNVSFLEAVRPLFSFVSKLPQYCKTTQTIGDNAIKVRHALLNAREPHRIVFEELPIALGFKPFTTATNKNVDQFFENLKEALIELQRAYDILLTSIEHKLKDALLLPSNLKEARAILQKRGFIILEMTSAIRLKAFILRLMDDSMDNHKWLESVASYIASKPPTQWTDQDLLKYEIELSELSSQFNRIEEIALERRNGHMDASAMKTVRLGITDNTGTEHRQIVHIAAHNEKQINKFSNNLLEVLQNLAKDYNDQVAIIAELSKYIIRAGKKKEEED